MRRVPSSPPYRKAEQTLPPAVCPLREQEAKTSVIALAALIALRGSEQPMFRQVRSGDPAGPTTLLLMAIASRTRRPRINRSRGHTGIATPIIGWRAAGSAGGTDEDGTRNVIGRRRDSGTPPRSRRRTAAAGHPLWKREFARPRCSMISRAMPPAVAAVEPNGTIKMLRKRGNPINSDKRG